MGFATDPELVIADMDRLCLAEPVPQLGAEESQRQEQ